MKLLATKRMLIYGSGRDAIRLLLSCGIQHRGWLRLWIPGYFCQEVVETILSTSITVMVYENNPFEMRDEWGDLPFRAGDVILWLIILGLVINLILLVLTTSVWK